MSAISYLDEMLPLVTGCTKIGAGCTNCYACKLAATRLQHHPYYEGLAFRKDDGSYAWTGEVRCHPELLGKPLHWRKPRVIGLAFTGDLFHESVPFEFVRQAFEIIRRTPHITYVALTKRAARLLEYRRDFDAQDTPNLYVGISVSTQADVDRLMPDFVQVPGKKIISAEPLLGPLFLWQTARFNCHNIKAVIAGCESGPNKRPTCAEWFRSLRDQCAAAGVDFYLKQRWIDGRVVIEPELDGRTHMELPWKGTGSL